MTGARALTYQQCAITLSEEWQRPVRYAKPGLVRCCRTLAARGVPRALIAVTVGLYAAARLGPVAGITDDVATVTGRPPRDFRTVARGTSPPGLEHR